MAGLRGLLIAVALMVVPVGAAFAIESVEPDAVVVNPGESVTLLLTSAAEGGSCFTADGGDTALQVEFAPQCSNTSGPTTFEVTISIAPDTPSGYRTVTIQEFDVALVSLLDIATVEVTVPGETPLPTTSASPPPGDQTTSTTEVMTDLAAPAPTVAPETSAAPAVEELDVGTAAPSDANAADGRPGTGIAPWLWMLLGGVIVATGLAVWIASQPPPGRARFRNLSQAASLSGLAGLVQQNRDGVGRELVRIAAMPGRLTMGFSQLAAPDAPLRFFIRPGRFGRGVITVVVSPEGSDRTVLVNHRGAVSSTRVSRQELRHALEYLVDDLAATGDNESAAALNRWLG
jgi:hypothetical protein